MAKVRHDEWRYTDYLKDKLFYLSQERNRQFPSFLPWFSKEHENGFGTGASIWERGRKEARALLETSPEGASSEGSVSKAPVVETLLRSSGLS